MIPKDNISHASNSGSDKMAARNPLMAIFRGIIKSKERDIALIFFVSNFLKIK